MTEQAAQFSQTELERVLKHYPIGPVEEAAPLTGGSSHSPKLIITTSRGKFLLKRRMDNDPARVKLAHALQRRLRRKHFPVSRVIKTKLDADGQKSETALRIGKQLYELFYYVEGTRYDGSKEQTQESGRRLALFHQWVKPIQFTKKSVSTAFHNSRRVRTDLAAMGRNPSGSEKVAFERAADRLAGLYNEASTQVNELGFDTWPQQLVHGDWHPGNMLFADDALKALLDFDSLHMASPQVDLANGLLQFSIIAGNPNLARWPARFDQVRLNHFMKGYCQIDRPNKAQLESLPDLMTETLIAEAVSPIAATSHFGPFCGLEFMKMVDRKATWLANHRDDLSKLFKNAAKLTLATKRDGLRAAV